MYWHADWDSPVLVCFFPNDHNCSESYVQETTEKIYLFRKVKSIIVFFVFTICIINNSTSYYVFNRKQFRGKILTVLIKFLYIGNIVYVGSVAAYVFLFYTYPFDIGRFNSYIACRLLRLCQRVGVAFTNWLLAVAACLRMNMTVFPTKLMVFRSKVSNSWVLLAFIIVISVVPNLPRLLAPTLDICSFKGRTICVIEDYDLTYFIFGYFIALFACVFSSLVIYYQSNNARKFKAIGDHRLYSPVNRMVISSSFLFAVSSIPQSLYYSNYVNESDVECEQDNDTRFILYCAMLFMLLCNNSLDSTIYYIVSPSYRKIARRGYRNFWGCITFRKTLMGTTHFPTVTTTRLSRKFQIGKKNASEASKQEYEKSRDHTQSGPMFVDHSTTPEFSTEASDENPVKALKKQLQQTSSGHKLQAWFSGATRELLQKRRTEKWQREEARKMKSGVGLMGNEKWGAGKQHGGHQQHQNPQHRQRSSAAAVESPSQEDNMPNYEQHHVHINIDAANSKKSHVVTGPGTSRQTPIQPSSHPTKTQSS